jgi:hypothetical protein
MSAVPVLEPIIERPIRPVRAVYVADFVSDPIAVPVIVPRHRARSRARSRAKTIDIAAVLGGTIAFVIVAGLTCFAASLMGNVMVEKARRDGIGSMERARFAARESAALREEVQALTSPKAIDDWAQAKGLVAAGFTSGPSGH